MYHNQVALGHARTAQDTEGMPEQKRMARILGMEAHTFLLHMSEWWHRS